MYLIDVKAVDAESVMEEAVLFAWDGKERRLERGHEDGRTSTVGFASSLGGALDKVLAACLLVGLSVTEVNIRRESMEVVLNG